MPFIVIGLVLAYNPVYSYYLMSHGAIGGMSLRVVVGGAFLIFVSLYCIARILARGDSKIRRSPVLTLMSSILVMSLVGVAVAAIRGNSFQYFALDLFPVLEMLCLYFFIRLAPMNKVDRDAFLRWILIYALLMCVSDVFIYSYLSFVKGIGFGALRANINGIVVNRLMDFMVPILGPGLILLAYIRGGRFFKVSMPLAVLATVGLTFYRTAYLAFFVAAIFLVLQNRKHVILFSKVVLIFLVFGAGVLALAPKVKAGPLELNISQLIRDRVGSILDSRKKDFAINSRYEQTIRIISELHNVAFVGYGFGGFLGMDAIQVTSNYYLQVFLLLGLIGGMFFVWVYLKVFLTLIRLAGEVPDQTDKMLLLVTASSLASLAVILCFFPYTIYFPLLYYFGVVAGIADLCQLRQGQYPGQA